MQPPAQQPQPQQMPMASRGRGGYKYTANARNAPPAPTATPKLNAAYLASLPDEQQKRTLGEALFTQIHPHTAQYAGKVTGMLLEMDNGELLHLLETPESLQAKVEEAVAVLESHEAKEGDEKKEESV